VHIVEMKRIYHLSAIIAGMSFAQSTDCQKSTDVWN